jgi:hypothetical protein
MRYAIGFSLLLLVGACAAPATSNPAVAPGTAPATSNPAVAAPVRTDTAPCTRAAVQPDRTAVAASPASKPRESPLNRPSDGNLTEEQRGELLRRQMEANHAFRNRGELPAAAVPGAVRCAIRAEDALQPLTAKKDYSVDSVQAALRKAGLQEVAVRPPGRLDLGYGDGVVFAGWTGQACVFGQHHPHLTEVEYGTMIADGGCLPAAD